MLIFNAFGRYISETVGNKANVLRSIIYFLVAFPLTPKCVTPDDLEWPFYFNSVFAQVRLALFAWISKTTVCVSKVGLR